MSHTVSPESVLEALFKAIQKKGGNPATCEDLTGFFHFFQDSKVAEMLIVLEDAKFIQRTTLTGSPSTFAITKDGMKQLTGIHLVAA